MKFTKRHGMVIVIISVSIFIWSCATYQQAKRIDSEVKRLEQKLDSMIDEQKPVTEEEAIAIATEFAGFKEILSVKNLEVIHSHSRTIDVMGNDGKGDILIGVNPNTGEVVKMVKQCPYPGRDDDEAIISEDEGLRKALNFLSEHKLPPITEGFILQKPKIITTWTKKHWEITYRHYVNDVELPSDFISFIVNAENGEISSYSKIVNPVKQPVDKKLGEKEAINRARSLLGKGKLENMDSTLSVLKTELKMLYPNYYFKNWKPVWSDELTLAWIIQFGRGKRPVIDIWISANTGELIGGEMYEKPIPELWGCMNQTGDIDVYPNWEGAMDTMQYKTNHTFLYPNNCPEADVINSIQNGDYFVIQSHGDTIGGTELTYTCLRSCDDNTDLDVLTPDEIPNNNLRYALFSHCMGGWDGPGNNNYREVVINRGADVFQGYYPYINPDHYERALLNYLMEGSSLWNAHWNAVAAISPPFTIVIEYGPPLYCFNQLRLAPLLVDVNAPSSVWRNATITATVRNREDARHSTATNVTAKLKLPPGFSIISGSNPQSTPALTWYNNWTAQWTVHAPLLAWGKREFDVEVWSDNLGVAVDDHINPYHKFEISFGRLFVKLVEYLELYRWWELGLGWYASYTEPKQIIEMSKQMESMQTVDDVEKDSIKFLRLMSDMASLELTFADHFEESGTEHAKLVNDYKQAVNEKIDYLDKIQKPNSGEIENILSHLSAMQMRINDTAIKAFAK